MEIVLFRDHFTISLLSLVDIQGYVPKCPTCLPLEESLDDNIIKLNDLLLLSSYSEIHRCTITL